MAEGAIVATLNVLGKALAGELVKLAVSKFQIFSDIKGCMSRINRELRVMKAYLDEMETDDESSKSLVAWTKEVQILANQIEDIVVEFSYLIGNSKFGGISFYMKTMIKKPKKVVALNRIAFELSDTEKSLKHLAQIKAHLVQPTNASIGKSSYHLQSQKIADDSHFINEDEIVGNKEEEDKLTNWLNSQDQELSVMTICGMGGVGKTTLATKVYKRERNNFDCHAWVNVSQLYKSENLLQNLISEIGNKDQNNQIGTTNRSLKETLRDLLENKKYCIVLDDMWDPQAYHELRSALHDYQQQGSRIVITTRVGEVANLAPPSNRLELKPLLEEESWNLFCRKAFPFEKNNECPSNLKNLAEEIVAKCDGLPLALVSLGNMLSLSENTETEWKRVSDQLTWQLVNNPNLDRLKNILNLSFKYLPRYLKNCFLYCSLFPEDFLLSRKKLIRLWVAEGFIEEKGRSTLEEVAEGYLKELIYRNMLQVVERNYFGRVKRCRMHDTLRELAISLCMKENFGELLEDNKSINVSTFARRISVFKQRKETKYDISLPQLRSFLYFDYNQPFFLNWLIMFFAESGHTLQSSSWLSMIFEKSRYITVLDLENMQIQSVPNAIGDLFNLHYLGLRRTQVKVLPKSIKKLHNLQTMDLCLSKIQKLPTGIVELKKLRHLFAEAEVDPTYTSLKTRTGIHLSKGMFYLKDLQTLQGLESNAMVVRELGNLTQLRSFRIWNVKENHSTELCRSLSQMSCLSFLSINASHENEFLHLDDLHLAQIQKLVLYGKLKENTIESLFLRISVEGIQTVRLGWCQQQNDPLPSLSICKNLTYLHLQRAYKGRHLTFQTGWFPKLKLLRLSQMPNLVQVEMEQGTMVSLEDINVSELEQLRNIPKGIEHLISLEWMICTNMPAEFERLVQENQQSFRVICHRF